jgi:hypothetical protein
MHLILLLTAAAAAAAAAGLAFMCLQVTGMVLVVT